MRFSCLGLWRGARYILASQVPNGNASPHQRWMSMPSRLHADRLHGHTPLIDSKYSDQLTATSATATFFLFLSTLCHRISPHLLFLVTLNLERTPLRLASLCATRMPELKLLELRVRLLPPLRK